PPGYGQGQGGPYGVMNGGRLPPNALGPGYPNTTATPFGGDAYTPGAYGYSPGYSPPVGYGGHGDPYGGGGYGNPYGGGAGGGYGGGGGLPAQPGGGPMGVLARRQQQLDSLLAAGQIHPKDYARYKAASTGPGTRPRSPSLRRGGDPSRPGCRGG
ncbi:MAG: hypothetical protein JWO38_2784, partial [Gemmataceae bacterium]|nr:hypothetical protein [Gemmataceae bacterium]